MRTLRPSYNRLAVSALACLFPLLMGGCPEFRNEAATAVETAVRGLVDAALDELFNQLQTQDVP